jgi:hypothetical protein
MQADAFGTCPHRMSAPKGPADQRVRCGHREVVGPPRREELERRARQGDDAFPASLPVPDAALGQATAHRPRLDGGALLPAGHHQGGSGGGAGAGTSVASNGGQVDRNGTRCYVVPVFRAPPAPHPLVKPVRDRARFYSAYHREACGFNLVGSSPVAAIACLRASAAVKP